MQTMWAVLMQLCVCMYVHVCIALNTDIYTMMFEFLSLLWQWCQSAPIHDRPTCAGGAQPLIAGACSPVCPNLGTPDFVMHELKYA